MFQLRQAILAASLLALSSVALAGGTNVTVVDAYNSDSATDSGLFIGAGQTWQVTATGSVNLAAFDGPYITDASGLILVAPAEGTGAYDYFSGEFPGGPVLAGGHTYFSDGSAAYGSLTYGFSTDLSTFVQLDASGLIHGIPGGGELYFAVFDTNSGDNEGSFTVSTSAVPEAGSLAMWLAGGLALSGGAVRRRRAAALASASASASASGSLQA